MTSCASPLRTRSSAADFFGVLEAADEQLDAVAPRSKDAAAERKCCTARNFVGAMSAAWQPFSMAMTAAWRATMVLPLPTSPWRRRFMGAGFFEVGRDFGQDAFFARRWA